MKIIAKDNFDRETVSDRLVAENIKSMREAQIMCDALQEKFGGDNEQDYYKIELDGYELYSWEP